MADLAEAEQRRDRTANALATAGTVSASRLTGFAPIVTRDARVLLLGSFPGDASLAAGQYYAHPRNQFWSLLAALIGEPLLRLDYPERLTRVTAHRIAIWDVNRSCERQGSLDSAIRAARANPFDEVLAQAPGIGAVAFNGQAAARHGAWFEAVGLRTYRLPSSSPAYASLSFEKKLALWSVLQTDGWIARTTAIGASLDKRGA